MEAIRPAPYQHLYELLRNDPLRVDIEKYFGKDKWQTLDRYFEEGASEQECPICFFTFAQEQYVKKELFITKCGHVFHNSCYIPKLYPDCSLCRAKITAGDLIEWEKLQTKIHTQFALKITTLGKPLRDSILDLAFACKMQELSNEERRQLEEDEKLAKELDKKLNLKEEDPFERRHRDHQPRTIMQICTTFMKFVSMGTLNLGIVQPAEETVKKEPFIQQ